MSELQQGLLIAAVGMGLVFAVIIFLWGLMALLMKMTSREEEKVTSDQPEPAESTQMSSTEHLRRVTAAAVAVRLALEKTKLIQEAGQSEGNSESLSPWQIVNRNRQVGQKRT